MLDTTATQPVPCDCCTGTSRCHVMRTVGTWISQILTALILAQSLFFKFTFAPEAQVIFEKLGGRPAATFTGLVELVCVILLVIPKTAAVGAVLTLMMISGAILSHLLVIGIQVVNPETGQGDGGMLFGMAILVAALSLVIILLRRKQLPLVGEKLR
ncbi:MAG: DoxX family protein [Phycisphaerales bacterium]|nr:DoxX family protein [Phycisphaerales bacterium]